MSVGSTIRKLRMEKGMTQGELGELLGVKKAAVQKYESGQVQNLKQETIRKLCEVFGKNPSVFIFDNNVLKNELDLLEAIESYYGEGVIHLLEAYENLNDENRLRLEDYLSLLIVTQSVTYSRHSE